jgi:hypothetical protein
MSHIYLLTGTVHSGKTSKINKWIIYKSNVNGILQPAIDGRRYIKNIYVIRKETPDLIQ